MGLWAADGSWNVTVVDGENYVKAQAPDGSYNVIVSDGEPGGIRHPCGALRVTVADASVTRSAPDGSVYVCEDPYDNKEAQRVTVVSGDLDA